MENKNANEKTDESGVTETDSGTPVVLRILLPMVIAMTLFVVYFSIMYMNT